MKPIQITIWDGLVIGGGAGLSLHAPIKIVTQNAHYFMPGMIFHLKIFSH